MSISVEIQADVALQVPRLMLRSQYGMSEPIIPGPPMQT